MKPLSDYGLETAFEGRFLIQSRGKMLSLLAEIVDQIQFNYGQFYGYERQSVLTKENFATMDDREAVRWARACIDRIEEQLNDGTDDNF